MTPFFGSFVSLNLSRSIKSGLPVTFKCLYNALSLSRFTFCLNRSVHFFILFLVVTNNIFEWATSIKKKMGNCFSKINKDHFFAFEEKMKNDITFFKEKGVSLKCEVKNILEFIL